MERLLLAYSGSDAATAALRRLAGKARTEVATLTVDLGERDAGDVRVRALDAGAARAHVVDGRERLAAEYLLPALRGGAFDAGLSSTLHAVSAPVLARTLVETAAIERMTTVTHSCSDDRGTARLERLIASLAPDLRVVRVRAAAPSAAGGESQPVTSIASNGTHAVVEIAFEDGLPVRMNDVALTPDELVESLDLIGRHHGMAGAGSPAVAILAAAYRTLNAATDDPNGVAVRLGRELAAVIDEGRWFTPLREGLAAFARAQHQGNRVTVRMRLSGGIQDIDVVAPGTGGNAERSASERSGSERGAAGALVGRP